uniref:Secreted protein n=1 Tax=Steinernema glaseri TaxID=37863 RepID=A0A1I7ZH92_9BILA
MRNHFFASWLGRAQREIPTPLLIIRQRFTKGRWEAEMSRTEGCAALLDTSLRLCDNEKCDSLGAVSISA